MYASFHETAAIIDIVLPTQVTAVLSPAMVVLHECRVGVDVAIRVGLLSGFYATDVLVKALFHSRVWMLEQIVRDASYGFINQSVEPGKAEVPAICHMTFCHQFEVPECIVRALLLVFTCNPSAVGRPEVVVILSHVVDMASLELVEHIGNGNGSCAFQYWAPHFVGYLHLIRSRISHSPGFCVRSISA